MPVCVCALMNKYSDMSCWSVRRNKLFTSSLCTSIKMNYNEKDFSNDLFQQISVGKMKKTADSK